MFGPWNVPPQGWHCEPCGNWNPNTFSPKYGPIEARYCTRCGSEKFIKPREVGEVKIVYCVSCHCHYTSRCPTHDPD